MAIAVVKKLLLDGADMPPNQRERLTMLTYTQDAKNRAREELLSQSVVALTEHRGASACLRRSYVRDLQRYLIGDEGSENAREAAAVTSEYMCAWEELHDTCVGAKRPRDLRVCYLAGPEPMNDFKVLCDLGVLPQNIWAFEREGGEFSAGLEQCCGRGVNQPKLIKMNIENFFESVPMQFDIVYLDFCSSLISKRKSLKCVHSMFINHRLVSPGVLITNFCEPDGERTSEYTELMARYFLVKENRGTELEFADTEKCADMVEQAKAKTREAFPKVYSRFVTSLLCGMGSIIVPAQRFTDSAHLRFISKPESGLPSDFLSAEVLNEMGPDPMLRFMSCIDGFFGRNALTIEGSLAGTLKSQLDGGCGRSALESLATVAALKSGRLELSDDVHGIADRFSASHRFLDKPERSLYIDFAIRQLSYPVHYCLSASSSIRYRAKAKTMYADAILFDDCRYVYDWLPAAFQGNDALDDKGWLYSFRFALDGLVKQRVAEDTDFFYKASVVSERIDGFKRSVLRERESID